ncbi:MAG TPA: hypothetical protein VMI35_02410, partial [Puia sp.]|nr:hypothetical protein [Puia sp.]
AGFLTLALPALSQKPAKFISVGFGVEGGIPVGDMNNTFEGGLGLTARFSIHAGPGFATLTAGGIPFVSQNVENNDLKTGVQIPVKAGYKYMILPHLFIMGELGYSDFKNFYEDQNNHVTVNSYGGFTYAPSVGVNLGVLEFAARYETVQLSGGKISYVGFRMGFNF